MRLSFTGVMLALTLLTTSITANFAWSDNHQISAVSAKTDTIELAKINHFDKSSYHFELISSANADAPASPSPAPSLAAPTDVNSAISTAVSIFDAVKSGNWSLAVALALMLIIYLVRMGLSLDSKFPTAYLPWISAVLAILGAVGTNLAAGESWLTAVLSGVTIGATASGLWSLLGGLLPAPASASPSSS